MDDATISDRIEIADLLTRYADAVDRRDWDQWKSVFTDDAVVDYSSAPGGKAGTRDEMADWLAQCMEMFSMSQHLVANIDTRIDGDTATVRAMFSNPMRFENGSMFFCGGWYNHELVRTPDGWKSQRLIEETAWTDGLES